MHRRTTLSFLTLALAACSPPPSPTDAGPDAGVDATDAPRTIAELPYEGVQHIAGLDGPVDVVVDRWGWPHIYATTLRDAMFIEGYLMARDRMPQMEILRRLASGTLAEAFGALSPSLIERDLSMRVIGLRRAAQRIWDATPPGRGRTALEAFSAGVNLYLAEVRSGETRVPTGTEIVVTDATRDWTPVDSLTIGRLQTFALSYSADAELDATEVRDRAREIFDMADPSTAPERAARRGFAWDFLQMAPPSNATVVPDFYASMGSGLRYRGEARAPRVPRALAESARPFFRALREAIDVLGQGWNVGSNNWVVHSSHSASGHALLANDPHLQLSSPPIWWGVYVNITQGPDAGEANGVTFPGLPGVLLGHNGRVAWGATVAFYDVSDIYRETITPGRDGAPDTVRFRGGEVPIETITETVSNGRGGTVTARIELVPHHGPIVPTIRDGNIQPRTGTSALSIRWTGMEVTHELDAFIGLMYARNVAEGRAALEAYGVGAMNWVLADVEGAIGYTTHALVPMRGHGATSWDPQNNPEGTLPCTVLPGQGEGDADAEWNGYLPSALLPNALGGPERPFIVSANNDQAGLALDGNPLNDRVFLSCHWAHGYRAERIQQRLRALGTRATREDMEAIQSDHTVLAADRYRPFISAAFARLEQEWETPGTHADLTSLAEETRARAPRLRDAVARLMAWSLDGASGVDQNATDAQRRDAVASTLFHAWLTRLVNLAFSDELAALSLSSGILDYVQPDAALFLLEHPDRARTRDNTTNQSTIWDDLRTSTVRETRDSVLLRALDEALTGLEMRAGSAEIERWLWGNFHTVRFESLVPGPGASLAIPPPGDRTFPNGFPRPGGFDVVDASEPGTTDLDFSYNAGASMRFTIEMDPAGPRAFNALPGGESIDRFSPFHANEAELWRNNQSHPMPRTEAEVVASYRVRLRFEPAR